MMETTPTAHNSSYGNCSSQHLVVSSISSTTSSLASSSSTSGVGSSVSMSQDLSMVNQTNLIVNYLPQTMTENEMRAMFEQIDQVERCKLIRNQLNQSLCYGFIKYARPESAERAIKSLNGLKLENKIIKVFI